MHKKYCIVVKVKDRPGIMWDVLSPLLKRRINIARVDSQLLEGTPVRAVRLEIDEPGLRSWEVDLLMSRLRMPRHGDRAVMCWASNPIEDIGLTSREAAVIGVTA